MTQIITASGFSEDAWAESAPVPRADYQGEAALLLEPSDDPSDLQPHFDALNLVIIPFGSSADGRGFSLARQLRALGYKGHIRARGHVLVDQFRAALRAGIDDIEISDDQADRNPEAQWQSVPLSNGYLSEIFAR